MLQHEPARNATCARVRVSPALALSAKIEEKQRLLINLFWETSFTRPLASHPMSHPIPSLSLLFSLQSLITYFFILASNFFSLFQCGCSFLIRIHHTKLYRTITLIIMFFEKVASNSKVVFDVLLLLLDDNILHMFCSFRVHIQNIQNKLCSLTCIRTFNFRCTFSQLLYLLY